LSTEWGNWTRIVPFGGEGEGGLHVLWEDGEQRVFRRGCCLCADGNRLAMLAVVEDPPAATLYLLPHEYGVKDELDGEWAVRPLALVRGTEGRASTTRSGSASNS
jgi:hypothetical protein